MGPGERYRRYSAKCLSLARLAQNDADRAVLLHMAEAWRQLAERMERESSVRDVRGNLEEGGSR